MLARYGLGEVAHFSDPQQNLYRAFALRRGSVREIFNGFVWKRGFDVFVKGKHGVGRLVGDGFQMPGVFLVHNGSIVRAFRHQTVADRPDYLALARCNE